MRIVKLTGSQLRAARALLGLTRDDLAVRTGISRDCLYTWEFSSDAVVPAQYQTLCCVIEALEDAGAAFIEGGVTSTLSSDDRPAVRPAVLNAEAAP